MPILIKTPQSTIKISNPIIYFTLISSVDSIGKDKNLLESIDVEIQLPAIFLHCAVIILLLPPIPTFLQVLPKLPLKHCISYTILSYRKGFLT